MGRSKKEAAVSARAQWLLVHTLDELIANPPPVARAKKFALHDAAVFNKTVNDVVTTKMAEAGYAIEPVFKWDEDYGDYMAQIEHLPWPDSTQEQFEESLRQARRRANKEAAAKGNGSGKENKTATLQNTTKRARTSSDDEAESASDEEWEDLDSSMGSVTGSSSFNSSKAQDRTLRLASAKKSMLSMMKESATKSKQRLSRMLGLGKPLSTTTPLKKAPTSSASDVSANASTLTSNTSSSTSNNTSGKVEAGSRAHLKRQASATLNAGHENPAKKTRAPSSDRAEFARSQNSRVQQVKERQESQMKERQELLQAKIQQKEQQVKERKLSKDQKAAPTKKVSAQGAAQTQSSTTKSRKVSGQKKPAAPAAPSAPAAATAAATKKPSGAAAAAAAKKEAAAANAKKKSQQAQPPTFVKPAMPPPPVPAAPKQTRAAAASGKNSPLRSKNAAAAAPGVGGPKGSPVASMQSKAKSALRQGELAKQAMFQSMLAAGDDAHHAINSTFLPGADAMPNFDASMAIHGGPQTAGAAGSAATSPPTAGGGDTFVVGGPQQQPAANTTYVSKPGLMQSPVSTPPGKTTNLDVSTFIDSFNESYRDYGLEDLCSDSDNTDDENEPSKPVPKWADLKSKRFKSRVARQVKLGGTIDKYGANNIGMLSEVHLEKIFETTSTRFNRLDTSSGMWNDTQDFIRD